MHPAKNASMLSGAPDTQQKRSFSAYGNAPPRPIFSHVTAALQFPTTSAKVPRLWTCRRLMAKAQQWAGLVGANARGNIEGQRPRLGEQVMKARSLIHRQMGFEALEVRFALSAASGLSSVAGHSAIGHRASVPAIVQPSAKMAPIASDDVNWSGYAVPTSANSVSYVAGSWVVPAVNSKNSGYSAIWVGIDGYSSSTVEQIGTEEDVVGGQLTYYAWYEMYPSAGVNIPNFTVKAGDSITASIRYDSTHQNFVLKISDTTESETYTMTQTAPGAARSSAEWVVEAPSADHGVLALANFGTVTFTNAYATVNGTTGPIDNWQAYSMNMVFSSRGRALTEASASSLSDSAGVSSFSVTRSAAVPISHAPSPQRGWSGWGGPRARSR
jgi:hypothetical protein